MALSGTSGWHTPLIAIIGNAGVEVDQQEAEIGSDGLEQRAGMRSTGGEEDAAPVIGFLFR